MTQKESRYAQPLRDLGFEPLSAELVAVLQERCDQIFKEMGVDRDALTQLEREVVDRPAFSFIPDILVHTKDETGWHWITEKDVEFAIRALTAMGFRNDGPSKAGMEMLSLRKQTKH